MKKGYLLLLLGAIPAVAFGALAVLNPKNVAETGETLPTRHYKTDLQNFVVETEKIIPTLSTYGQSWRVVESKTENNAATIKAEVPVLFFTDDLVINANFNEEKNETTINIRSASRVGKSDLGENRRHILQILEALDERF